MFKRILVPVDFSSCSKLALQSALRLAEHFDSSVEVMYAYSLPALVPSHVAPITGGMSESIATEEARDARDRLQLLLRSQGARGKRASPRTVNGPAADSIIRRAHDLAPDLIVMGTHGRSGLSRMVLGSVASNVLRRSPCAVMTVRQGTDAGKEQAQTTRVAASENSFPLRRILVPVELPGPTKQVLERLADSPRASEFNISLLHVFEPLPFPLPKSVSELGGVSDYTEVAESRGKLFLHECAELARLRGLNVTTKSVAGGVVADEILKAAEEHAVDCIALSSHQREGVNRLLLGSIAERVVATAVKPVLVIPPS